MFGTIIVSIGTLLHEVSDSIGKYKTNKKEESLYTMAFLSIFWSAIIFVFICITKQDGFIFKAESLPTFAPRIVLEIIQLYATTLAIIKSERSAFGFIRILTIPLLLAVDFFLGYKISNFSIAGVSMIVFGLLMLFANSHIKKKGLFFMLFSSLNAVATLSLYKYDITNYNSVAAEQLILYSILLLVSSFCIMIRSKQNPLRLLMQPALFLQSATIGLGGVLISYGFNYGTASTLTSVKRVSSVFWSLFSGKTVFKEKHFVLRLFICLLLVSGLALLVIS